jgi:tRNA A-37 threonylcarbamoyl transferase component Bud32
MPRAGDVVAAKYRIESVIGEGGMGAVFSASHLLTGKRVALKWMLPELAADTDAVQRFMREAQAAGRIDHPNVVDIYDVGEHEGSIFLVMEYLHGETLTAAANRGDLNASQIINLLLPAMRGVAAAHRTGVVHRDLKPDNIFLCSGSDGGYREPKVLDFGISKVSSVGDQMNPRLTRTGAVMGTPYYMSPEQIRGSSEVDERTDVYAFGVILYEALTGHVPFDADAYSALILEIATGTPKRLRHHRPELPDALERVVLRAMAREPEARYRDVESLAMALEPFADGSTFHLVGPDRSNRFQRSMGTGGTPFISEAPTSYVPVNRGGVRIAMAIGGLVFVAAVAFVVIQKRAATADDASPVAEPAAAASTAPALAPTAGPGDARRAPATPPGSTAAQRRPSLLPPPAPPATTDAGIADALPEAKRPPPPAPGDTPADNETPESEPNAGSQKASGDEPDHAPHRPRRTGAEAPSGGSFGAPRQAPSPSSGRTGTINSNEF